METDFSPQPHEEAIALIKGKPLVTRQVFDQLLPELRARTFMVTGIEGADVLQRVRDAIAGLPEGQTWDEAKDNIVAELDPFLGDGSERRAELLLRTHSFQAFQASNWDVAQADDDTTHLQYLATEDDRVRESHAALNGLILPKDDAFWDDHYPPWEWNCRCRTRTMNSDQVEEARKEDEGRAPDDQLVMHGAALKKMREGTLIREGQTFDVSANPDPDGFHWHPTNLRIPIAQLKGRYDPAVWNSFESWAANTQVSPGVNLLDWLKGEPPAPPARPEPIAFHDRDEAKEWADDNLHPDNLKLTPLQRQSLISYQLSSSGLNTALINGNPNPMQVRQSAAIMRALGKAQLDQPITVWHGSGSTAWARLKEGDVIKMKSFLSTTLAEEVTDFKSEAWITINVPAGAKALYMDEIDGEVDHGREVEILLGRGQKLQINSVENDGEIVYITADLIP